MKKEVESIRKAMNQRFSVENRELIYNPMRFRRFCMTNGAPRIFDEIFHAMTERRHSEKRKANNKLLTMNTIYKMCYGKSQKCNFIQKQHGIYLKFNHLSQEGLDTEKKIGNTVCSRTVSNEIRRLSTENANTIKTVVEEAIERECLLVMVIDDYTTVHSKHRPTVSTSSAATMCTIICRIFPDVKAIPLSHIEAFHDPYGINVENLQNEITGSTVMKRIGRTFSDCMPDWLIKTFFDPESERHRLQTHMYHESDNLRKMRSLDNLYLVDFTEQPLKSQRNFEEALDIGCSSLGRYMERFAVLVPGDWPAQFYVRRAVYSSCKYQNQNNSDEV